MDTFKICKVLSVSDDKDTDTIKVRFEPDDDKITTLEGLPECFPLLPKQYFIKPKVGEAVLVFTNNPENAYSHRFYIGPLISQPHKLNKDEFDTGVSPLNSSFLGPDVAPSTDPNTEGVYPDDNCVSMMGRGDSDIQINEDDLRLRCGVKISDGGNEKNKKRWKRKNKSDGTVFNRQNPGYLKIKYYRDINQFASTATIVADKINLITHGGQFNNLCDKKDLISEQSMKDIVEKAHKLPYGDILIEFLQILKNAFLEHVHGFPNMPPCVSPGVTQLINYKMDDILCENIQIE